MNLLPHIQKFNARQAELEAMLSDPAVFDNSQKAQELSKEYARLKDLTVAGAAFLKAEAELVDSRAMLKAEPQGSELAIMAQEDISRLEKEVERYAQILQWGILPPDPADSRNTIVELRAGAGGAESALFAAELYRMYCRFAESHKLKVETLDTSVSDLGGLKEVIFSLIGEYAYKHLKYESGVHRVQRVPATEAQGRIHTSTVTVAVLPEAEEVDVEIRPEELEINVCRAGGHGGQGVNTTDSAVRIVHKPSGIEVRCQDERSQQKNKAKAMKVLRSRLLDLKVAEEKAKYDAQRNKQVGTGERSEKIRTYNFPQNRVTDHRIDLTIYNLSSVMEGDLDGLIEPLMANDLHQRLEAVQV